MVVRILLTIVYLVYTQQMVCKGKIENEDLESSSGNGSGDNGQSSEPPINMLEPYPTEMSMPPTCTTVYKYFIGEIQYINSTLYNLPRDTCIVKTVAIENHDVNFHVLIGGCLFQDHPDKVHLYYSDLEFGLCGEELGEQYELFKKHWYSYFVSCQHDHQTDRLPVECLCDDCFQTPRTKSPKSSLQTSLPPLPTQTTAFTMTSSLTSTSNTYKTSSEIDPKAAKLNESVKTSSGLGGLKVALVAIASFLAGILVTALFLWIFHLRRTSGLCFREPEKTPKRMTSEKRTKMVLAKHMTLEKKGTPASDNKVYFVNESAKKHPVNNSTGMYEDIGHKQPPQSVYTTISTSGTNPSAPPIEEHVYKDLDLQRPFDDNEYQLKENNKKDRIHNNNLTVGGESEADVFDHNRESAVSGHDYFILQNENFRNSSQTGRLPSNSSGHDDGVNREKVENNYFVLEKQ